jgi:Uma2 family endonuclease
MPESTTAVHVSEAEYLATHYRPDCDWVDGEIEERTLGEKNHAKLVERIRALLELQHLFAISEVRLRVYTNPSRYRVPDVCAYRVEPNEQVFTEPPLIVVEVLSPEDRLSNLVKRAEDYLHMGVEQVWLIASTERAAYTYDENGLQQILNDTLQRDEITLHLPDIFSVLR